MMMKVLSAATLEDLLPEIAEHCMRLGRLGGLLESVEVAPVSTEEGRLSSVQCAIHYRWAELGEPTHMRRMVVGSSSLPEVSSPSCTI